MSCSRAPRPGRLANGYLAALAAASLLTLLLAGESPAQGVSFLHKSMRQWLTDLKSPKPAVRRSAAFALGRLGDDAWIAVPDLAFRLRHDEDASVREMAASAVGDILVHFRGDARPLWDKAGPELTQLLQRDPNPRVKRSAAYALGAFAKAARDSEKALKGALADGDATVRQNAAWALGRLGQLEDGTIADLCDRLRDDNVLVRRDAAGALGLLGRGLGKTAARPLLDAVKSEKDDVVRKAALDSLAHLAGPEHKDHAVDLYPLLESKDVDTARGAAFVLGNIGEEVGDRPVAVLRQALADSDPGVQALAAAALSGLGKNAAGAVEDLAKVLTLSQDPVARRNCAVALAKIGADARNAVPSLATAMKVVKDAPTNPYKARPYEEVREFAAEAVAQIRYPDNAEAIPVVRELLRKDTNQTVRQRCVWALFNLRDLDKYDLVPVLDGVLAETNFEGIMVRYDTARVLAFALREKAPDRTVDTLMHMLTNKSLRVYNRSDATVEGTGSESSGGTSSVRPDLGGDARFMAAEALGWMAKKVKDKPAVIKALKEASESKSSDPKLREKAKGALEMIDEES